MIEEMADLPLADAVQSIQADGAGAGRHAEIWFSMSWSGRGGSPLVVGRAGENFLHHGHPRS